jgi:hypothetical protein
MQHPSIGQLTPLPRVRGLPPKWPRNEFAFLLEALANRGAHFGFAAVLLGSPTLIAG